MFPIFLLITLQPGWKCDIQRANGMRNELWEDKEDCMLETRHSLNLLHVKPFEVLLMASSLYETDHDSLQVHLIEGNSH